MCIDSTKLGRVTTEEVLLGVYIFGPSKYFYGKKLFVLSYLHVTVATLKIKILFIRSLVVRLVCLY